MPQPDMPLIRRPAIYARVSTEEQAQSGTSLETQVSSLKEQLPPGGPEPLVYIDDGYSGSSPNRPALMDLESAIADGKVSEVRVASLDRLARDLVLQETLLNRWARQGIGFRSLREPDLGTADATRVLIRQVLGAISQYERAVIASRMLAGRIARAHQGFWPGGKVPFGYQLEGNPPRVVLDAEKGKIVREAGTRVIAGERVTRIAQDFERRGIPGPGGNGWEPGYLSRLLKNPAYKGEGRYRVREYVEPVTRRKSEHAMKGTLNSPRIRPEEEWITYEIPAVLSEAEWEKLQSVLSTRTKPPVEAGSYLLSRRFYTACGAKYYGNYNNGKTRYLCYDRLNRKRTGKQDCGCPAISSGTVDEALWRTIAEVLAEPERLLTTAREELNRRGIAKSESTLRKELASVDRKLTKSRGALARLARYHAEQGTLDQATFEAAAQPLRDEIAKLEQHREKLLVSLPDIAWREDEKAFSEVASQVLGRLEEMDFSERQRLVTLLNVEVRHEPDGQVSASLSAPHPSEACQRKVFNCTFSR